MVNYFIYAKDFSGSTGGSKYYHTNGIKTVSQFKCDVEKIEKELLDINDPAVESKIVYLHWGSRCYEINEDVTLKTYAELQCGENMGTEPGSIIQWIRRNCDIRSKKDQIKLIYIVTDGIIEHEDVVNCFKLNKYVNYETVVFHAFNENLNEIDLSVAASFFKKHCMVYRNYELFDNVNISEDFDYDKINIDNFTAKKDNLKSYIKLKYINKLKHDILFLQEIDKLKNLRQRLFAELSLKSQTYKFDLDTKDKNMFLCRFFNTDWYKNLISQSHCLKVEIEKAISSFINYIVSETKSFSFDALRFETNYDKIVEEEPIVDVNFEAEQEITFPDIILGDEKGIPVILITELNLLDKLIFHTTNESAEISPASFNRFKSAMECPLFLLNDSDISDSIGYFYTLTVYKELLAKTNKTEPRTRRPFYGGLVLIDTDEFDKYNDYVLAATYFDSRKVHYNVGLFYYILWNNCKNKEWMDRNVVRQFEKYVMRRISATMCKIGLSGLPLDPPHITTLPTALWYCVELSSCIFKDDPLNFLHERLRMYYGLADYMIEILKNLDYDLDLDFIIKRRDIIRDLMILKRLPTYKDKVHYLLEKIFKTKNGFLVSEIEKPYNLSKLNYLGLNHKAMLSDNILEEKVHLNDFVHLMHFVAPVKEDKNHKRMIKICTKTFRPFFSINSDKSFYTELLESTKKIVIKNDDDADKIEIAYDAVDSLKFDRILSLYNLYINFVKQFMKYPTLAKYMKYILNKKKFNGDLVTIFPVNVVDMAEEVFFSYQDLITKVEVKNFTYVCKSFVNRAKRVKEENILESDDEKVINDFISSEEQKANLSKKEKLTTFNIRIIWPAIGANKKKREILKMTPGSNYWSYIL